MAPERHHHHHHHHHQQQQQQQHRYPAQPTTECPRVLLVALLLAGCLLAGLLPCGAEAGSVHRRFYRRAVRLCSRSLSDALYLLCKDRGYNEPFPNSSEAKVVGGASGTAGGGASHPTGPGLVEECCYNSCTIEQMEQYCKPPKPSQ